MINQTTEELEHGINLIKKASRGFKITARPLILFSDVEKSFFPYSGFIFKFIEVLILDALIGNQDRHSENWAIIRSLDVENSEFNKYTLFKWAYEKYKATGLELKRLPFKKFLINAMHESALVNIKFSPIYDSGSSLGREIPENRITSLVNNKLEMEKYIANGKSEISWNGERLNHFALLRNLKVNYNETITSVVNRVLTNYKPGEIEAIIGAIDDELPNILSERKLSLARKELILKFIDYRIIELKKLLD